jgi:hypothetical protein
MYRGHVDRKNYSIMKFGMRRLKRTLVPAIRRRREKIRVAAATLI